ncbi:AEC family transporter [Marinimicrobium locisalis]|uniref:AEC family transporter n=1 Tax=Marinimicrobium locisalis TaxID=546022 RepID=UPI003221C04F
MSHLLLIVVCLGIGLLLQRAKRMPAEAGTALNIYVLYVALPAMILTEIPKLTLDHRALLPVISTWVVMTFTALLVWVTARWLRWSRSVTGALMLIIVLGNTSFVGIPLIQALLPPEALPYALLYDQVGTVIALNTYAVVVAAWYSGRNTSAKQVGKTIVTFPPLVVLAIAFLTFPLDYPEWLRFTTARISESLVPVVMVAVGLQWQLKLDRAHLVPLGVGLGYKLVLIPAVVFAVFAVAGLDSVAADAVALQTAMPSMISAGVVAMAHGLAPRLVSTVVGYGLLLSLITVPLWSQLL